MPRSSAYGRRQSGMGYLWLLLATGMLALAAAGAQLRQETLSWQDRERELLSIGRQFASALCSYYRVADVQGQHHYPPSLDELLRDSRALGVRRHLRRVFVDPMSGRAEWGLLRAGGRIVGVHSLSPRKPLRQAGRDGNMDFTERRSYREWVFTCPQPMLAPSAAPGWPP